MLIVVIKLVSGVDRWGPDESPSWLGLSSNHESKTDLSYTCKRMHVLQLKYNPESRQ